MGKDLFYVEFNEKAPTNDNPCVRLYGLDEKGRKCKTCNLLIGEDYHNKVYYKCSLRKRTRGAGSDHRVRWDACVRYAKLKGVGV